MLLKNLGITIKLILLVIISACLFSCQPQSNSIQLPIPKSSQYLTNPKTLSNDEYHDKILGALVGSAIGDAMGASTEMWHRDQIQEEYGFINGLTTAMRDKSPEGTWGHNLGRGTTTDDTRWKYLMVKYMDKHKASMSPDVFAKFITNYYSALAGDLSKKALDGSDALDEQLDKVNWMIEWDRVAKAYQESPEAFQNAKSRFYGGEMSCAGMLYSPMFGLIHSAPEDAYTDAFSHSIFDIGYAKDITAIVAAMTSIAMQVNDMDSIVSAIDFIDPQKFRNSRLIGRLAQASATAGVLFVKEAKQLNAEEVNNDTPPENYKYGLNEWQQQSHVYKKLDESKMPISFHAGEIWQILIASLEFGEGDFLKTMQFIVNYGRDNDTVAAIAGMILGAKVGYQALPADIKQEVINVNRDQLGIDLESLAQELTQTR